jgi:hypothetical protein
VSEELDELIENGENDTDDAGAGESHVSNGARPFDSAQGRLWGTRGAALPTATRKVPRLRSGMTGLGTGLTGRRSDCRKKNERAE